jgi:hypothetical protein
MAAEGEVCFRALGLFLSMNWLMYLSWFAGPTLQITLLACMVQRKLQKVFPRFFSYIMFQILKTGALLVTYRNYPEGYFDAYWAGNAISVVLAIFVMDEILHKLFKEYGGAQNLGSVIFRWSCGLLLVLAIVNALYTREGASDQVVAVVLAFERSVRVMQCGLVCLLLLLCRLLRHCWRQPVFGIALGFGIFASVELILVSIALRSGNSSAEIVSLLKSAAYNVVTVLWIFYLRQQTESIPGVEPIPIPNAPIVAMSNLIPAGDRDSFISMVERVVDQVLSRGDWPRPATKASQIISRKLGPEDRN